MEQSVLRIRRYYLILLVLKIGRRLVKLVGAESLDVDYTLVFLIDSGFRVESSQSLLSKINVWESDEHGNELWEADVFVLSFPNFLERRTWPLNFPSAIFRRSCHLVVRVTHKIARTFLEQNGVFSSFFFLFGRRQITLRSASVKMWWILRWRNISFFCILFYSFVEVI